MFLSFSKPTLAQIDAVIGQCQALPYNYPDIGCTNGMPAKTTLSTTYAMDHNRCQIGAGQAIFLQAKQALMQWRMCNLGWAEICGTIKPTEPNTVIACVPKIFGLWFINPCRVVYKIDDRVEGVTRFGLAYGTLPGHAAAGEERFLVEWHHADDTVWYDILAFSRPGHRLAKIGYPVMRRFQKRYGRDSVQAMMGTFTNKVLVDRMGLPFREEAESCRPAQHRGASARKDPSQPPDFLKSHKNSCLTDSPGYGTVLETFPESLSPT